MSKRPAYAIETLSYSSTSLVRLGSRKVAILFPPLEAGGCYQLYPHPDTFRSLPLRPEFMPFESLDAVRAFLGIRTESQTAHTLAMAA
jgi:hypothetical protein